MTLLVDVLGRHPLPTVRAIVSVPAGAAWELHGTTADGEWLVASGTSTGYEVVTADPWAPLGVPTSYRLTYGSTVETDGPVMRHYTGESAITDLTGRTVVNFRWMRAGGDPRSGERRAHFSRVSGSAHMPARLDPVAGMGGGGLQAQTMQPSTDTFRALLASNRPLILLHNRSRCEVPGCDTPAAQTVYFTGDDNDRSARTDAAHRVWDLPYRILPSGVRDGVVPVVSNRDVLERFASWQEILNELNDLSELPRGDWMFQ